MAAPLILANSLLDAHTFAREELGLGKGHYRVVTSPSSISGRRGADLYLVPGHEKRYDRFAMAGALKYTRLNKIDVTEWREDRDSDPITDGLFPEGVQLTLVSAEEASAFFDAIIEPEGFKPPGALTAEQVLNLAANPDKTGAEVLAEEPKRRRRRCKDCGTLHFKDESCPSEPLPGV